MRRFHFTEESATSGPQMHVALQYMSQARVYIIVRIKQNVKIFSSSLLHALNCGYKLAI